MLVTGIDIRCHEYPQINLTGKWLEELGIQAGDKVKVQCKDGQIAITKV
jgi:formylmethanofuran dehydrogenase subunit D